MMTTADLVQINSAHTKTVVFSTPLAGLSQEHWRLMRLTSGPDWDHDGASAVPYENWYRAWETRNLVSSLLPGISPPSMSPCPDGSVHLRWGGSDMRWVEIEVHSTETWYTQRSASGAFASGKTGLGDIATVIATAVA